MRFTKNTVLIQSLVIIAILGIVGYYTWLQENPDIAMAKKLKATFCEPSPTMFYPPRPSERTVIFPDDKVVGNLYTTTRRISYVGSHSWELLGAAKGKVFLPDETSVFLEILEGSSSILASLEPNSIQVIDFSAPIDFPAELYLPNQTKHIVPLSDEVLKPLAKMKALYRLPAQSISGWSIPDYPPSWSMTAGPWQHPVGTHGWVEFCTSGYWEMADPSAAFRMPVKSMWFGRNDGGHLCYGERSFIEAVSKKMKSWAKTDGKIVGGMTGPYRFMAGTDANGVSIRPEAMLKVVWDGRWFNSFILIVLMLVAWYCPGLWRKLKQSNLVKAQHGSSSRRR